MIRRHKNRSAACLLFVLVLVGSMMVQTIQIQRRQDTRNKALLKAIATNDAQAVQLLLAQGAYPNARGPGKPVHDPLDLWTQILDVNHERTGLTAPALMFASGNGKVAIVEMLLDSGAETNAHDFEGNTPLIVAALNNKTTARPTILLLVKYGANIYAKTKSGYSAWTLAIERPVVLRALQEAAGRR